ncbi:hypothetical protein CONLIGDRAFT_648391 [Coniochaeta ligniaria NRRL 30616]|uniref:Uncharacterized protein n=1 Tax=Coniochaeta ligniaria NRRL 30616 TaxID=1408157 RepID=A0A1J7ID16_9PEZI|nr:hypothetical protein CONLIGDRAFT_648391 [Coniochaeta ligniaria NRRL 30616]
MGSDRPESTPKHGTPAPPQWMQPDQKELQVVLMSSRPGWEQRQYLGKDGVLRTLTTDSSAVVNAIPLSPSLIKALLDRTPHSKELEDILRGVDGTAVPSEQWFNPNMSILPLFKRV